VEADTPVAGEVRGRSGGGWREVERRWRPVEVVVEVTVEVEVADTMWQTTRAQVAVEATVEASFTQL
jgi:hypothetical protein